MIVIKKDLVAGTTKSVKFKPNKISILEYQKNGNNANLYIKI